ncbi:DNA-3-methyladenine glycosylase 2 [Microlunatus parietis]|uniref:DNA-3-methyladenine glycosylase II n=1 Tax=Microlunatus parietis TaxID=682979 RepID=A0A7Y9I4T8_9ACTN|nr:AlkA N-terminal domain-containing protein [Microlunatus parietis]NYE70254.1 AraC family transcriptional regulator of adaptative response / DNA-3-methyladenine glycosylase II [Microlunatus parietis]
MPVAELDQEACRRAAVSRDARFDGVVFLADRAARIYCRPSCTLQRGDPTCYPSAAAAQRDGHRACPRCRPDAVPGSPEWDVSADPVGRAMRLIADGVVEREGVAGLAVRTGSSPGALNRLMTERLGAGPLALARNRRAHTARVLIEQTQLPFAEAAFAAGFTGVRPFTDTIRAVYGSTPRELRASAKTCPELVEGQGPVRPGTSTGSVRVRDRIVLDLPVRQPFDGTRLLRYLADRAIGRAERVDDTGYRRTLSLPGGPAVVRLSPSAALVRAEFALTDLRDLAAAVERCRRLLDLDADPILIDETLAATPVFAPLVRRRPGLRVPGHVDGFEVAVRAIVGQQVSVAGARTVLGRIAARYGSPLPDCLRDPEAGLDLVFPTPEQLAEADPEDLPMPRSRGRALVGLAEAVAAGRVPLDYGTDRADVRRALLALPGIGPWTADYIAMRALGDPDIWLGGDLGVKHALTALGVDPHTAELDRCRPWRSYAVMQLWSEL